MIADAGTGTGIANMRARTNTMAIKAAACADRSHMGAGMHAAVADTGARGDHMAGMAAGRDAMLVHAGACADVTDMRPGAHAMFADMRADTHAKTSTSAPMA